MKSTHPAAPHPRRRRRWPRRPVDTTGAGVLIGEALNKSQVMTTLEFLTDVIGPRLTGSPAMKLANDWTEAQFKLYGLSASQEAWEYGVTWERGPIAFQIEAPFRRNLTAHSWAWTAGTGGKTLTGPVVLVDASTPESLAVYKDKIKGAWLMLRPAGRIWNPDGPPMTAADSAAAQAAREARHGGLPRFPGRDTSEAGRQARRQFAVDRNYLLKQYGALGVLTDGGKEFGLMTMSGSPYSVSPLPNVVIAHEDYAQFGRLLEHGVTPTVSGRVDNTLGTKPVTQWNTIGEIKGTEWPDQVVILGAHLDSWDLGTGTTDNATGSVGGDGGGAGHRGQRPQAEADHPLRALQRRGAGAARVRRPMPPSTPRKRTRSRPSWCSTTGPG